MFWNLVRYEFKNVNKWYLALYAAVLSLSVIRNGDHLLKRLLSAYTIISISIFGFWGLMITLGISTLILIIQRFKGSVYDRRISNPLTLPYPEHQILSAKLLEPCLVFGEYSGFPLAFILSFP